MNKTLSRVLLVIAGVLLVIAGIVCLRNPDVALGSMSLILGFAMLFSGIVDILVFAWAHNYIAGSGWFLLDGIVTVLLSLFVLCNDLFIAITLPFIFGMWLLFSGIAKFVNSFDLQRLVHRFGRAAGRGGFCLFSLANGKHFRHGGNRRHAADHPGHSIYRARLLLQSALAVKG